jgi:drug/metabolite transporter (DMT)-like permease
MNSKFKYHILMHLIIFVWGFTGILGKLIHLDAYAIVWHRLLIAVTGFALFLFLTKRDLRTASKNELFKLCGTGVVIALHWMTFYKAIELSTASLGILCLSTTTLHVTWLEPLIMKRRFSIIEFLMGLVVIYGIYFVSSDFNAKEIEALKYGLTSALLAAMFSVFNARMSQEVLPYKMSFYELSSALVFVTIYMLFMGRLDSSLFQMAVSDLLWLLFLGLVCTSIAFLISIEVVKRLGAFTFSLSVNLEPVYTILLAIFILNEDEVLGTDFYLGSGLIVVVIVLNALIKNRLSRKKRSLQAPS